MSWKTGISFYNRKVLNYNKVGESRLRLTGSERPEIDEIVWCTAKPLKKLQRTEIEKNTKWSQ